MEMQVIKPPCDGWIQSKLPDEAIARLWEYVDDRSDSHKDNLAGNITESNKLFDVDGWFAENYVSKLVYKYAEEFGRPDVPALYPDRFNYVMNDFWVNFQNKHEFNPIHCHLNCLYSFVVWMKIPTDWREQHEIDFIKGTNSPRASDFQFIYTDMLGEIRTHSYRLDKDSEGTILLFNSGLKHVVYPFYNSDETRISISGNIGLAL